MGLNINVAKCTKHNVILLVRNEIIFIQWIVQFAFSKVDNCKSLLGSAYEIEKQGKLLRLSKKHKSSQKRLDKLNWKGKYIYYHKE